MNVTLKEVYESAQALFSLTNVKMSGKTAYRVARNLRKVAPIFDDIERKRIALVKEYAPEPDEKGNVSVPADKTEEFTAKFQEMLKSEVEVDIQPLTEALLDGVEVSPSTLLQLGIFLVKE